ncbi:MAG: putative iron-regulated membrane protein [Cryomorphaceae bacterium]|jgi:uncharacterized iron-regulated membrane protein
MKARRLSQKTHKWLGLLAGLQLVIWTVSGFYMVVVDIDIIHGDHLVQPTPYLSSDSINQFSKKLAELSESNPDAQTIELRSVGGRMAVEVRMPIENHLFDAISGEPIASIDVKEAKRLALNYYAGSAQIKKTTLIESEPPREIGGRGLPLWRVDFDDAWGSTFYISPSSGALATRRHTLWRVFDFLWMLHIMDYDEREDVNNLLLRLVSLLAFMLVLSGVWYLYFRLNVKAWFAKERS